MKALNVLFAFAALFFAPASHAAIVSADYRYHPVFDNDILPGTMTEVWARLYRPENLGNTTHPLIVLLHGNHATCGTPTSPIVGLSCSYTFTGSCANNQAVIPNHLGYEYLANELASRGYIVVSINANRGITCGNPVANDAGLNLARGRLILRHLALLSQWNRFGNAPTQLGDLQGKIDFSHVGLLGHSRGGEGVRAAYELYRENNSLWRSKIRDSVQFRAIFEIGPVDGQTSRVLNADGLAWNVLLPTCDGDVTSLQGMKVFDRMSLIDQEFPAKPKSMFAVKGANHNFYNTQWQENDSSGCVGATPLWNNDTESFTQRQSALDSVTAFFLSNLGPSADKRFDDLFNPLIPKEPTLYETIQAYLLSSNTHIVTGMGLTAQASSSVQVNVEPMPDHDPTLNAIKIGWSPDAVPPSFENTWKPAGEGYLLTEAKTFDFRITRTTSATNTTTNTDFRIQLLFSDGTTGAAVKLSDYGQVSGPTATVLPTGENWPHLIPQTIRIPIEHLIPHSGVKARGVRFIFDQTVTGEIYLSNVSFSKFNTAQSMGSFTPAAGPGDGIHLFRVNRNNGQSNASLGSDGILTSARPARLTDRIKQVARSSSDSDFVEIEIEATHLFPVQNSLPVLMINGQDYGAGGFGRDGSLKSLYFKVRRSDLQSLPSTVRLGIGHRGSQYLWSDLGTVSKSVLQR